MDQEPSLRDRLISAGIALLERDGIAGMTLRKTAALAGVSHAAPAHHFDGLPGLLTAIAVVAFDRFAASMEDQRDLAPPEAKAQLLAIGVGYLAFARANAGLFHVMFQSPLVRRDDPEVARAASRAHEILCRACLPFSDTAGRDPIFETLVWTMVHGYALLGITPPNTPPPHGMGGPPLAACLERLLRERGPLPLAGPAASG